MSRVRAALLRRLDHVWDLGWWNLGGAAIVGFFLCLAWFPLSTGIDGFRAAQADVEGAVTVAGCRQNDFLRGDPWRCRGTFRSADGTVRIERITYDEWLDEDPRVVGGPASLPARVSGPGASRAHPVDDEWQPVLITGIFAVVVAALMLWWWTGPDERPLRPAAPAAARPRSARRPRPARRWGRRRARPRRR
ncbi:hypothetical protein [Micromonospora sp. L31]|uniref:hypothetical protein n=1 Tax=Micromonospora sp. L31 TaxID=3452213 RepID=UPI003F8B943F